MCTLTLIVDWVITLHFSVPCWNGMKWLDSSGCSLETSVRGTSNINAIITPESACTKYFLLLYRSSVKFCISALPEHVLWSFTRCNLTVSNFYSRHVITVLMGFVRLEISSTVVINFNCSWFLLLFGNGTLYKSSYNIQGGSNITGTICV